MAEEKVEENVAAQEQGGQEFDQKEFLQKVEDYYNNNSQLLNGVLTGVLIVVGGIYAYLNFYLEPLKEESKEQVYKAQQYFEQDSFRLALRGDGNYLGFEELADEYSMTKVGELANYYAGICSYKLGNYEEAVDYLKNYSSDDLVVQAIALSTKGDAHMELDEISDAISSYKSALGNTDNNLINPIILKKLALAYEVNKDYAAAKETYLKMQEEYPKSNEARDADKYIAKYEAMEM